MEKCPDCNSEIIVSYPGKYGLDMLFFSKSGNQKSIIKYKCPNCDYESFQER